MRESILIVGGGLASCLMAYRLASRPQTHVTLLERSDELGGNHTWSFHASDVSSSAHQWLRPFLSGQWAAQTVRFHSYTREIPVGYASIRSDRLDEVLRSCPRVEVLTGCEATEVSRQSVRLATGETLEADLVFDGRGMTGFEDSKVGYQKFLGQDIELESPHGLTHPILMDATVEQLDGYRFFYLLPWDETRLLVEDTRYSENGDLEAEDYRSEIREYVSRQGWRIARVEREEVGVLPIPLRGDYQKVSGSALRLGVRGEWYQPTTGYSLPHGVRLAEGISRLESLNLETVTDYLRSQQRDQQGAAKYFYFLNRLMFFAAEPEKRYRIFERFYRLNQSLIERFYKTELGPLDKVRLLAGRPPVPVNTALARMWQTQKRRRVQGGDQSRPYPRLADG